MNTKKMKAVVIGAAGHIGTYLVPMLVNHGFETIAITRGNSQPYEDNPAWKRAKRVFLDRDNDPDFVQKLKDIKPDIIVDLVNLSTNKIDTSKTMAIVEAFKDTNMSHYLYCSSCWAHGMAELVPFDSHDLAKDPICVYGEDKATTEYYLLDQYRTNGFPVTIVAPGQISGPGWDIINPWGNISYRVFQDIADGKEIALPNFGQEIVHNVHGYDVAQVFYKSIIHRENALGQIFEGEAEQQITLYGYAKHMYKFFGHEPKIKFLPWPQWCEYEGNKEECDQTYLHIARSGYFSIERQKKLIDYQPRYKVWEVIELAVQSYIDRGIIKINK